MAETPPEQTRNLKANRSEPTTASIRPVLRDQLRGTFQVLQRFNAVLQRPAQVHRGDARLFGAAGICIANARGDRLRHGRPIDGDPTA